MPADPGARAAEVALLRWHPPGPYTVAFSTRAGGVSSGPYASLNLGLLTDDEPENVGRNRALLCAAVGADPHRATMAWQQHGATVVRAEPRGIVAPGTDFPACDGLWSDEPGQALLLIAADCLPIALVRVDGERPALAILHAGRQGILRGIVAAGVRALGGGRIAAAIGPAIGPCCYEVGEEEAAPYRASFGADVVREGRRLDLWTSAERALRAAGVAEVDRMDTCTACNPALFFSHRRDRRVTGRQGVLAYVS